MLPPSKYHSATGAVVEAALTRILADILALTDIPEVDSHRLSELCRILNALEGLFTDGTESVRGTCSPHLSSRITDVCELVLNIGLNGRSVRPILVEVFVPIGASCTFTSFISYDMLLYVIK